MNQITNTLYHLLMKGMLSHEQKYMLKYFEQKLSKEGIQYKNIVVAYDSYQFEIENSLNDYSLDNLMCLIQRAIHIKKDDTGKLWLIIYKSDEYLPNGWYEERTKNWSIHKKQIMGYRVGDIRRE